MKLKSLLLALLACLFTLTSCEKKESEDKKMIEFTSLPTKIQQMVAEYFPTLQVAAALRDKSSRDDAYDVIFTDGTQLEFSRKCDLTKVLCISFPVPEDLLPNPVRDYLTINYPENYVTEWSKDDSRWEAKLNNGLELIFDKNYQFVGLDD